MSDGLRRRLRVSIQRLCRFELPESKGGIDGRFVSIQRLCRFEDGHRLLALDIGSSFNTTLVSVRES